MRSKVPKKGSLLTTKWVMCKIILTIRSRPVARFFYGEVRSNKETDQKSLEGQVCRGGELCLSENELHSKFAVGGPTSNALA